MKYVYNTLSCSYLNVHWVFELWLTRACAPIVSGVDAMGRWLCLRTDHKFICSGRDLFGALNLVNHTIHSNGDPQNVNASMVQTTYIIYVEKKSEKSDGCQQEMESYKSTLYSDVEVQKNETIQTHKYSIHCS